MWMICIDCRLLPTCSSRERNARSFYVAVQPPVCVMKSRIGIIHCSISSSSCRLQDASWLLASCVILLLTVPHVVIADEDAEECEYTIRSITIASLLLSISGFIYIYLCALNVSIYILFTYFLFSELKKKFKNCLRKCNLIFATETLIFPVWCELYCCDCNSFNFVGQYVTLSNYLELLPAVQRRSQRFS